MRSGKSGFVAIQDSLKQRSCRLRSSALFRVRSLAQQLLAQLPDQEIFLKCVSINRPKAYTKKCFEIARRAYYHDPIEDAVIMKRNPNER